MNFLEQSIAWDNLFLMKNNFIAFADSKLFRTFKQLSKYYNSLKIFEKVYLFDESNLPTYFKEKFKDKHVAYSRG